MQLQRSAIILISLKMLSLGSLLAYHTLQRSDDLITACTKWFENKFRKISNISMTGDCSEANCVDWHYNAKK